jgi:hypothetical protein
LTFDAGDNDPRRFFMHFQSLLTGTPCRTRSCRRALSCRTIGARWPCRR